MPHPAARLDSRVALGSASLSRRGLFRGVGAAALAGAGGSLLTACGGGDSGSSGSSVMSFWQFYGPKGDIKAQSDWFVNLVGAWNKENDTDLKLQYVPVSEYLGGSKLPNAFAAGDGPDIFLISPGDFLRYYNGGALVDITSHVDQQVIDDYADGVLDTRMVDGKVYGLPMEVEPLGIYYSLEAFEKAGLSEGDIPATWDQLLDVADKLTTSERFGVAFETAPGYYQNFTWYPFMWMGNPEVDVFDVEAGAAALQLWKDAVDSRVAPRKLLGNGGGDAVANLGAGYCAMQQTGIWSVAQLRDADDDFKYGVFPLPTPDGATSSATTLGGWSFVANAKGANPEAAAEFIAYSLGTQTKDCLQRGVSWATEAKTGIPPRESVLELALDNGAYSEGPLNTFATKIAPTGRSEPRFPPEVYKPISDAIQAAQLGRESPMSAAEQAAEQIDAFVQTYDGAEIL